MVKLALSPACAYMVLDKRDCTLEVHRRRVTSSFSIGGWRESGVYIRPVSNGEHTVRITTLYKVDTYNSTGEPEVKI